MKSPHPHLGGYLLLKMDSNISSIIDLHHCTWEVAEDLVYWMFLSPYVHGDGEGGKKRQVVHGLFATLNDTGICHFPKTCISKGVRCGNETRRAVGFA